MNELWEIAHRGLALLIIFLFLGLIYLKIRRRTFTESWDEIHDWVGAGKK